MNQNQIKDNAFSYYYVETGSPLLRSVGGAVVQSFKRDFIKRQLVRNEIVKRVNVSLKRAEERQNKVHFS